ncbi:MAG TPA: hypothetical protein V6D11_03530 [Waterburya sp.]|jgi:hypothetical protein
MKFKHSSVEPHSERRLNAAVSRSQEMVTGVRASAALATLAKRGEAQEHRNERRRDASGALVRLLHN